MKNTKAFSLSLALLAPLLLKSEVSCLSMYSKNPETCVTQQHAVNFEGCTCNCAQHSWLDNGRCVACGHNHAQAGTAGVSKTNGTFLTFTSPSDALSSRPTGGSNWLNSLISYAQDKASSTSTFNASLAPESFTQ